MASTPCAIVSAAMWIVKLALRRPYTFIVLAIVIMLLGVFSISRTPPEVTLQCYPPFTVWVDGNSARNRTASKRSSPG